MTPIDTNGSNKENGYRQAGLEKFRCRRERRAVVCIITAVDAYCLNVPVTKSESAIKIHCHTAAERHHGTHHEIETVSLPAQLESFQLLIGGFIIHAIFTYPIYHIRFDLL